MVRYIKCPRCELNYIDADKQEYCDVCIAEMKGNKLQFADLEDEELDEALEAENTELCPVCGVNRMPIGDTMCESCRRKAEYDEEEEVDPDKDEEWKSYLDDDMDDLTLDDEELEEEFKEDEEEEDEPPRRSSRSAGRTQPSRTKNQRGGYKPKNFADMDEDDDLDFEFLDLK